MLVESPKTNNQCRVSVHGKFFARGSQRLRFNGVTYGPFKPNSNGEAFPSPELVCSDFEQMQQVGINSIRTYYVPPEWFLDVADEKKMTILVDVPWAKHICFIDNKQVQKEALSHVQKAAELSKKHPSILAFSIGNEIPPDIIRWYGAKRIERFLKELMDAVKQSDPDALVTYSNYPPTEYLDLSFLDFFLFNVYLHDLENFHQYLMRLQHIAGNKPLILGEIGMDTLRQGEREQADFLAGHVKEAILLGIAGIYVFAWTDDWFTGGYQIEDWAFGITKADRSPKPSCHILRNVFSHAPAELLKETPRASVLVCSYNGGETLDQCLNSLIALDYPDYEVILVDDGSRDNTHEIAARYPDINVIHQENLGLSVARNVGLQAASGSVIAYTDSDCFADPDWLTHLVYRLQQCDASAVGGPNINPENGRVAACIDASPGQPTHVMENDQVAEHIPGCNMAFNREALEAINGFDPEYHQAGDDVDVCWRFQQAGKWITFAPGAFVWHYRRQTPRKYLRQQRGYGKAEALLKFKHPDKFNSWGQGKWRGVVYGASLLGLRLGRPIIYRGTFGTGLFQTIYQPGPAHWTVLPSALEWHGAAAIIALASLLWPHAWIVAAGMFGLSVTVAALQATQVRLDPKHEGLRSRLLITFLFYIQPLVRSWQRYMTRIRSYRTLEASAANYGKCTKRLPLTGIRYVEYWTEDWKDRTELLNLAVSYLTEQGWKMAVDSGWTTWDLEVYFHPWTTVRVNTVQEDHGGGKRLIRVRYRLRTTRLAKAIAGAAVICAGLTVGLRSIYFGISAGAFAATAIGIWWRGACLASQVVDVFHKLASNIGLVRCEPSPKNEK